MMFSDARSRASLARPAAWVLLAAGAAFMVHVVILLTLRRGFDWTDEAWSYSLIANSRTTEGEAWGFQHLLHGPFEWFGESVLAFRFIRFGAYGVLTVVSTVVLARISAHFGFRLRRWEWWLVLVVAQIGTFLAWSFPPRYFAYNELSALLAQAGALGIAALMARAGGHAFITRASVRAVVWAGTGLTAVFLVITKFTSGAAFGVFLLASLVIPDRAFGWGKRLLSVAGGAAAAACWLLVSGFPIRAFTASIRTLLFDKSAQAANAHPARVILRMYEESLADGTRGILVPVVLFAIVLGLLFAAGGRVTKDASISRVGAVTFFALAMLSTVTLPSVGAFLTAGRLVMLMAAIAILALVAGLSQASVESVRALARAPIWVGFLALLGAPFVCAVGTNNPITGQILWAATGVCTMLGIALVYVARRLELVGSRLATMPVALLALFVLISATQVAGDVRVHPFRSAPYFTQSSPIDAPYLQGMLVTQDEADWATWLVSESKTLDAEHTPTVALGVPGALLIFNNSSYASPWLADFNQVAFQSIGGACNGARPDSLLVIQPAAYGEDTVTFALLQSALESQCSVAFPKDFEVVAKHESSQAQYNTQIWRLRG